MRRLLYKIVDSVILLLCLPFYAVAVPLIALHQFIVLRVCWVRPGQDVTHWPKPDVREDLRVVDVSRIGEGLVGVQRRTWNVLYDRTPPPYSQAVQYCTLAEFWFGNARFVQ
jgi:hypothetical protein